MVMAKCVHFKFHYVLLPSDIHSFYIHLFFSLSSHCNCRISIEEYYSTHATIRADEKKEENVCVRLCECELNNCHITYRVSIFQRNDNLLCSASNSIDDGLNFCWQQGTNEVELM
jgi:hypothetical protein